MNKIIIKKAFHSIGRIQTYSFKNNVTYENIGIIITIKMRFFFLYNYLK
jgi:hypothetical protein